MAEHLHLKVRARGLSEAQFVLATAESIALGARCLDDLATSRGDAAQALLRGFAVPAPQTAGTWLRRFSLGHIHQLDKVLMLVQRNAFRAAGVTEVTLDFDSTYVFSRTKRAPGRGPHLQEGLRPASAAVLRHRLGGGDPRPAPSGPGWSVDRDEDVPDRDPPARPGRSGGAGPVRLRFYGGPLLEQLERAGVTYLCGVPLNTGIVGACRSIPDECWEPCRDKDTREVAEFGYRLSDGLRFRRYVVKRIPIQVGEQATLESGGFHYWVLVTNDHHRSAPELESGRGPGPPSSETSCPRVPASLKALGQVGGGFVEGSGGHALPRRPEEGKMVKRPVWTPPVWKNPWASAPGGDTRGR